MRVYIITILASFIFAAGVCLSEEPEQENDGSEKITWYSFEWLPSESHLQNPRAIMRFDPVIEGLSGFKGFQLCLDVADSYIYESAFENILWRKPELEKKILRLHSAGRTQTRVFEEAEVSINDELIGYNDFQVIDSRNEPEDINLSGFFGYKFFQSIEKILIIDHRGSRFALLDELPEAWESEAHLVRMRFSPSFLGLRLRTNGRRISLSFDGEPNPALVLYRNRDFRRIASDKSVQDSLRYYYPPKNLHLMLGGKEPEQDLYFGPYKLKSHNVYHMPKRDYRLGNDQGLITQSFFEDYVLIVDYKNERFGIVPPAVVVE